jgi:hypothetical protein
MKSKKNKAIIFITAAVILFWISLSLDFKASMIGWFSGVCWMLAYMFSKEEK